MEAIISLCMLIAQIWTVIAYNKNLSTWKYLVGNIIIYLFVEFAATNIIHFFKL